MVQCVLPLLKEPDWLRMALGKGDALVDVDALATARAPSKRDDRNNDWGLQEVASTVSSSGCGNDPFVGGERCSERR
jgi:hypothetical protein